MADGQFKSKHAELLKDLTAMAVASVYRFRRAEIVQAQTVIIAQEQRIIELEEQLNGQKKA